MVNVNRTGMIATKLGMSQIFNDVGEAIPVTLLSVEKNIVLSNKSMEKHGYNAVVVGYSEAKPSRKSKSIKGICAKANTPPVKHMAEFRVSDDALLEVGKQISLEHFIVGQLVDVAGRTIGKGFAGSMKRHNFHGLEASHGVSVSHRSHGSTGQRQDPGKVFKNKKMAGHMGHVNVTIQNIEIISIDLDLNIIALKGAVPGCKGTILCLSDAIKKTIPVEAEFPAKYVE